MRAIANIRNDCRNNYIDTDTLRLINKLGYTTQIEQPTMAGIE